MPGSLPTDRYKEVAVDDAGTAVLEPTHASEPGAVVEASSTRLVVTLWVSDSVRNRLVAAGGVQIVDDLDRLAEAELIVVSTRIPPGEAASRVADLRTRAACPIVVIVHPGGEDTAVDLMAAGATGLVAEGNEPTIAAFFGKAHDATSMIEAFEQTLDRRASGGRRSAGDRDPVTRMRGLIALDGRLAADSSGAVPRLAWMRVLGFEEATRRLSVEARDLLRRRIATQFEEICSHRGAEVFDAGPGAFAVVTDTLPIAEFERLGRDLMAVMAGFSPDRAGQLALAVGHAGPEATSSIDTLRELAVRGMQLSAEQPEQGVIGAERLALTLASGTELESALRAVRLVETRDAYPDGHGERVSRYAGAIAEQLGLGETTVLQVRLAARLHDVGKLSLSEGAAAGTEETLSGADLAAYKEHPARGSELLRAAAGHEVAQAVRCHHERWDGTGFPDGIAADAIPLDARIIAVANALDRWSTNGGAPDRPTPAALQKIAEQADLMFDPTVVAAAAAAFAS
jgi:HD-GYP domain-containing protein (c-di-GMP phosphodiesterase class II)